MDALISKKELIDWISKLEDQKILKELESIKRNTSFNFEDEFKKAIPLEEAKQKSIEKIHKYWDK
ncbi:hypothetical protein OX284_010020 [Flavobacterium sp. SUN046]|uniref:hypothetical protein n=1 Tax=Flavobacterium sp. SUN046 TaxID=3002440 RepID=UPI002DB826FA|nr:hypothetical protein [Flavobacterium sp. SUN046]MEC4049763.1 hypothetical protein [Flavobacterium sp. SUN046]